MDHLRTPEDRPHRLSVADSNDHEQLAHGFVMYDALYSWLEHVRDEKHDWNPQRQSA